MRFQIISKKIKEITKWHDWFAWYPIIIDIKNGYKIVWLEKVSRKAHYFECNPDTGLEDFVIFLYKEHE